MHCVKMTLKHFILFLILATDSLVLAPDVSTRFEELLQEISGTHLRFSATHLPPFLSITKESNGTFSYKGMQADISDFLAGQLNITYSFVHARVEDQDQIGHKEAAVKLLMGDEVDIVTFTVALNFDHCVRRMDCSCPLELKIFGLLVPFPEEESRLLAPLKPFQPMIWIVFLVILILTMFVLSWIPELKLKLSGKERGRHNPTPNVISTMVNQGNQTRYKQLSFRIVLACWCLSVFILTSAYSSILLSFLMVTKHQPVSKSYEDLANGRPQNLKVLAEKNQFFANLFLNSESGTFKILGDSLRDNPETLFTNSQKAAELMSTGHFAYVAVTPLVNKIMDEVDKKAGFCRVTVSNDNLPVSPSYSVFAFQKNWRYTDAVNYKMQLGWESGLFNYWAKKHLPRTDKCLLDRYSDASPGIRKLSLKDLSSPFVILLLGLSLSFFVFLVELIWHRLKTHRKILNAPKRTIVVVKDNNMQKGSQETHSKENLEVGRIGEIADAKELGADTFDNK